MATDAPPRRAGGGLDRKVGPLPLKIWLLIGAALVVGFIFLRHPTASGAATNASDSSSQLPGSTADSTGASGSPSDAATADLLAALGNDNQMLLQGLLSQSQLFWNGGAQFVPGSSTSSLDTGGGGDGTTEQVASLIGYGSSSPMFAVAPSQQAAYQSSAPASYALPSGGYGNFEGALPQVSPSLPQTTGTPSSGHNVAA